MENKTLTAVEWLFETMQSKLNNEMSATYKEMFEQALVLERTEIIEAFKEGFSVDLFDTEKTPQDYIATKYGKQ